MPKFVIEREIPGSDVIIHIDPCNAVTCPGKDNCQMRSRFKPRPIKLSGTVLDD